MILGDYLLVLNVVEFAGQQYKLWATAKSCAHCLYTWVHFSFFVFNINACLCYLKKYCAFVFEKPRLVLSTLVCCWFFICQSIDSQFVVANEQVIGGLKMLGMIQFFCFISEY